MEIWWMMKRKRHIWYHHYYITITDSIFDSIINLLHSNTCIFAMKIFIHITLKYLQSFFKGESKEKLKVMFLGSIPWFSSSLSLLSSASANSLSKFSNDSATPDPVEPSISLMILLLIAFAYLTYAEQLGAPVGGPLFAML